MDEKAELNSIIEKAAPRQVLNTTMTQNGASSR